MSAAERFCFLDAARPCDATCRAFDAKKEDCTILKNLGAISSSLQVLQRVSSTIQPPKVLDMALKPR